MKSLIRGWMNGVIPTIRGAQAFRCELGRAPSLGIRSVFLPMIVIGSLGLAIGACTMTETQQRVGTGAAIGAAGGAVLGGTQGAVIGAAAGGAGGYMVDQHKKRGEAEAENEKLRQENEQLRQQQQVEQ